MLSTCTCTMLTTGYLCYMPLGSNVITCTCTSAMRITMKRLNSFPDYTYMYYSFYAVHYSYSNSM